jgi:hypothetical protein
MLDGDLISETDCVRQPFASADVGLNKAIVLIISNSRLVALSDGNLTFRWRDSAHGNKKRLMTLPVQEFLRRSRLHLLPSGFVPIRNFGFLANRNRASLVPPCFQLLREDDCLAGITVHRSDSSTLELSSLRRCHARRRAAFCCAIPAALATPTRTARSIKLNLRPRPWPVLRRIHGSLVSFGQNHFDASLSTFCIRSR